MKASEKIRDRIAELEAFDCKDSIYPPNLLAGQLGGMRWALDLVEAEERVEWALCSVTPVPRTVVSETRPAWIEVWLESRTGSKRPEHLEPIGPFDGYEYRYNVNNQWWTPIAWRFVSEVAA